MCRSFHDFFNTSIRYVDTFDTSDRRVDLVEIFRPMAFDPSKPYNDLPLLPPGADLETRVVLKACIEARAALAELKQAGFVESRRGVQGGSGGAHQQHPAA
jgi:hypothetical protein